MGDLESSLAAFLVKASLRNYYEREGVTGYLSNEVMTGLTLKASYTIEEHASLRARDPWTIIGDSKEFRTNPPVDEGTFTALTFQAAYDTRDNIRLPHTGWFHEATFEIARDELGGDIDHTRWFLHMRRYHILRAGHFLNARLALAGSSGNMLEQRLLTAGGVGTLRGYDDVSVSGDHMVLGNIEYRFPTGLEKLRPVLIVFNEVAGMVFLDAGRLWFSDIDEDEDTLSDIGVGFSGANFLSYFGLYLAWPLTGDEEGARLSVKIQRDF
jgi:outer membrane protein assembly factor BamA